jgi:hypothetical protein
VAKEIILDIKQPENKVKVYLPWIIAATLLAAAIFLIGFGVGKYTEFELPLFQRDTATKSAERKGWYVFETKDFSFEYPKNWEVESNPKDEPTGGKVLGPGATVEFWLDTERAHKFTEKQKAKQKTSTQTKFEIDGRKADVTEYPYKGGDFFIVIQVAENAKRPKVVFWINASDLEFKKTVMEIVSTFETITVEGKIN